MLATGNDPTVTLYDVASGLRLGDPVTSEAPGIVPGFLAPDGSEMFVSMPNGVAVWDLNPAAQLDAACRIAGRQLTPAEWASYPGGFGSFRETCSA